MSDEGLRRAYQRAVATRAPGERSACPAPEAILALVRREGEEDGRLALLDHVMACAECRSEFELLRAIERAGNKAGVPEVQAPEAVAAVSGQDRPARVVGHIAWRRWAPLLAAAAVVLVVALGPGRQLWQRAPEPVRGGVESFGLIAPAEAGSATSSVAFLWHSSPEAERYTLEVLTGGGAVVLSRTTTDTAATVTLPANLAPGDYRWWVTATAPDGSTTRSGLRALRLRGR